jgi:hypothetical protein
VKRRSPKRARKTLAKMTDAEFRKIVSKKYKFDPLPDDQPPRVHGGRYTGTDDLYAEFNARGKVRDIDLIQQLALAVAESNFLELEPERDGIHRGAREVRIRRGIVDMIAIRLFGDVKKLRENAAVQKGIRRGAARHGVWRAEADLIWAKKPSLSKKAVATVIARKLGGKVKAGTIRRVIVKPNSCQSPLGK